MSNEISQNPVKRRNQEAKDKARQRDNKTKIYFVLFFLFAALATGGLSYFKAPEVALKENNCPQDSKLIGDYALIVVDETDPIVGEYQTAILDEIKAIFRNLPQYGKFSLHDITTGQTRLDVRCAPDSSCNPAVKNCDDKDRHDEKFREELESKTKEWFDLKGKNNNESRLIQRLYEISELSDFRNTENRSIHIFSDMLQHDSGYSHHRRRVGDDEFDWLSDQSFYPAIKPELKGVSVYVYYLKRNKYRGRGLQTSAHEKFWEELFEDAGAAQVTLRKIDLPGEESSGIVIKDNRSSDSQATHKSKSKSSQSSESTESKPQPASPPPSNSSPEQQEPSTAPPAEDEDIAREYRKRFILHHDMGALSDLLDLHLQNRIAPEIKESNTIFKIYEIAVPDFSASSGTQGKVSELMLSVSPETRGKVGELMLVGAGGFDKNTKIAYLLIQCAGDYQEKIRILEDKMRQDDVEFLKDYLKKMRERNLCKRK